MAFYEIETSIINQMDFFNTIFKDYKSALRIQMNREKNLCVEKILLFVGRLEIIFFFFWGKIKLETRKCASLWENKSCVWKKFMKISSVSRWGIAHTKKFPRFLHNFYWVVFSISFFDFYWENLPFWRFELTLVGEFRHNIIYLGVYWNRGGS